MPCSVVIPCHNGADLTRLCVQSLLEQRPTPPTEILLVDNGSADATAALGDLSPRVRVLRQPHNLGFAGGVNRGIAAARCDDVLVLNNDTQAASNLLDELRRALHSDPRVGASAPVSNHVKGEAQLLVGDFGRDPANRRALAADLQGAAFVQDVDTLAGLCLLLRRRTLDEVGCFDERFGHGNFEDDDLCLRLRLHGYRLVIARRAFLHHEGHATFQAMGLDLREQIGKRLVQFDEKWRAHPAGRAALADLRRDRRAAALAASDARRRAPRWPDADWHIGRFHEAEGDAAVAAAHLEHFLGQCPEHVEAGLLLGLAQVRAGDADAGRQTITTTLRRHRPTKGQHAYLERRLGELCYEAGRADDAAPHYAAAVELAPDDGAAHNGLGLCLLAAGDVRAASASFEAAIERGFALAHTNLGICRHHDGHADEALAHFEKAVELLPYDPVARANYDAGVAARAAAPC